jgi:Putative Ig domain
MPGRTGLASLGACVAALVLAAPALALDIADAVPTGGTVGVTYSLTFSLSPGSGSPGAKWTVDSGALPPGLKLSSNDRTATVSGTPTQAGTFRFYLKVRDKPGPWVCCTEEEFTITIDPALEITASPDLPPGNVGASYGYQLVTAGGTAQSWTLASGALPPGMTLSAGGALTGTPTQAALAQFTVRAADGSRSAAKQFTLKVIEPIVVSAPAARAVKVGGQFVVSFGAKGGLAPYTWTGVGLPAGVAVNAKTGQVGGRPKTVGRFTVTLTATDSLGTSSTATTTMRTVEKLAIVTTKLPVAHDGRRFKVTLRTSGGAGPLKLRLAGAKPKWLKLVNGGARLAGTPKLERGKPLFVVRHTKQGAKRIVKKRPLKTATYNLYLTAVDQLGQRSVRRLKLIVKP